MLFRSERARARARGEETEQLVRRSPTDSELQAAPISSPTIAVKIAISRRREIAQLIAISPSTEIAINGTISRDRDASIARSRRRELAPLIARSRSQIAIVDDIFLGFVFSFFFSKHQKIFSGKFFEMQPTHENIFLSGK